MTGIVQRARDGRVAAVLSAAIGAAVWLGISWASGRREAWDSELYWTRGYPILAAVAAVCGWLAPRRAWRWPLILMLSQLAVMMISNPSGGSLLPLGVLLFGVLSVPLLPGAYLGVLVRRLLAGAMKDM